MSGPPARQTAERFPWPRSQNTATVLCGGCRSKKGYGRRGRGKARAVPRRGLLWYAGREKKKGEKSLVRYVILPPSSSTPQPPSVLDGRRLMNRCE